MISVSTPDPERFAKSKQLPNTNIVASWESKDGKINLFISEKDYPQWLTPSLPELEVEFMKEISSKWKNGKLLDSSVKKQEGRDFFSMTAKAEEDDTTCYFTQALTNIGGRSYIASAFGSGSDTRADRDAKAFIGSFKTTRTSPSADSSVRSHENDHPQVGKDPDENWIPKLMGSIAAFCVIGAIIAFLVKSVNGQDSKANRSSRRRRQQYDDDEEDEEDRPRSRRRDDDEDRPRNRRRNDEEDEEDRPKKRRKWDDDDEDEDRPRRRQRDRD
jgi:hypothetical protein